MTLIFQLLIFINLKLVYPIFVVRFTLGLGLPVSKHLVIRLNLVVIPHTENQVMVSLNKKYVIKF